MAAPLVAPAACTAMRRSELLGLRWLDVGIENGRVMLAQTKNVEGRIVYLNETAKAAITSLSLRSDLCSRDLLFQALTFTAMGTYGELSQPEDITGLVVWHNDNPSVLTLDPGSGNAAVAAVPRPSRPRLRQLHRDK
jgi:hypothetical protein